MDEVVGHMTEKVVIPPADEIEVTPRRHTSKPSSDGYRPYEPSADLVPEMAFAGEGYNFHVTGITHDERGYPAATPAVQEALVGRLRDKIRNATNRIVKFEADQIEGADVVVVSYGITSRVAQRAIEVARQDGLKVGMFRLITAWPFPEEAIASIAKSVKAIVVPELNLGQMVREVERAAAGRCRVVPVSHAGGSVHRPEQIVEKIMEAAR
jgi:2-oxoglutarate/2-oxoacid ferredoxin oxidoreductase subunit alpha